MNFNISLGFLVLALVCCTPTLARYVPQQNEFGDTVEIGTDPTPQSLAHNEVSLDNEEPSQDPTPTSKLAEQLADVLSKAVSKGLPTSGPTAQPDESLKELDEINDDPTHKKVHEIDGEKFNQLLLNAVLDAVRHQVNDPNGNFDFMAVLKHIFNIWAARFDYDKDGDVTIAEFVQYVVNLIKEKINSF